MAGRRRFGVRARVVASFLVLLAVAEIVSVVVLQQVGASRIDEQVTRDLATSSDELRARVAATAATLGRPGGPTLPEVITEHLRARPARSDSAELAFVDGAPFAVSAGAPVALAELDTAETWAALRRTATGRLDTDAGEMRWLAVPLLSGDRLLGVYVTVAFVDDEVDALRGTVATVSLVTVLVLAGACLLAWGAAGRALAPLRDLASTARSISSGDDLDAHIEVRSTDEVGDLATSFNEMLDDLRAAFDSQKRFLDGAAHELRTPITIVRGHLELLDDDPVERAKDVELILDEVDRMARLVEELRVLARAERPDFLVPDEVDLAALLADIGRKAASMADREWSLTGHAVGTVRADPQRLTQAVLNLVDNAIHVTTEASMIEIGSCRDDDRVSFWVLDDGPGIAATDIETLFEREGRTIARRPGGTGLGLPIVAAVARAHGGTVAVRSSPGEGARFEIRIPVVAP